MTNGNIVKEIGAILDVVATVQEDGQTIELKMIGRTENIRLLDYNGVLPLPTFTDPPQIINAVVWDGMTVAVSEWVGNQHFVILVTPSLIDPAGNPIQAEVEKTLTEAKPVQQ